MSSTTFPFTGGSRAQHNGRQAVAEDCKRDRLQRFFVQAPTDQHPRAPQERNGKGDSDSAEM